MTQAEINDLQPGYSTSLLFMNHNRICLPGLFMGQWCVLRAQSVHQREHEQAIGASTAPALFCQPHEAHMLCLGASQHAPCMSLGSS